MYVQRRGTLVYGQGRVFYVCVSCRFRVMCYVSVLCMLSVVCALFVFSVWSG